MKKIICTILCALLVLSLASCGKKVQNNEENTTQDSSESTSLQSGETETTKKEKGSLKDTVKITIPLAVLEEKYQKDIKLYCADYGYQKAKINRKNQTVTITMKAFSHELLLTDVGMNVIGAIYEIAESKDYPYINRIENIDQDNFKSVVYSVDKKTYEKGSLASFMMAQSCLLYQLYTEDTDYRVDITVIDKKTGEQIETITYTDKEILK